MLLGSKQHTQGDTKQWTVQYGRWLANSANIEHIVIQSDSTTCTVNSPTILGTDVVFSVTGGMHGERVIVALTMTDTLGNIKNDTVVFTVVAP